MARATIVMGALVGMAAGCVHDAAPPPAAPVMPSASAAPTPPPMPAATPSVSATAAPSAAVPLGAEARLHAAFLGGVPPLDPAAQLGHATDYPANFSFTPDAHSAWVAEIALPAPLLGEALKARLPIKDRQSDRAPHETFAGRHRGASG